jgi:hypothetical protein
MKFFIPAILVVGFTRFVLSIAGFPNSVVKYCSMTALIAAGTMYFAVKRSVRRDRLKAAYLLILPYMIVEVSVLTYTWTTGHQTIFHAPEYSFGTGIALHTLGHLLGGITWEPLFTFVLMEIIRLIYLAVTSLMPRYRDGR